jgi:hypothetical protein
VKTKPTTEADISADIITDHAFDNVRQDGRCAHCGLARAAHRDQVTPYELDPNLPYRCPNCVTQGTDPCPHELDYIMIDVTIKE